LPSAVRCRSSHDFGFRFTGSGFENAFSPFERPVKPRGSDAVHNSDPTGFSPRKKGALEIRALVEPQNSARGKIRF
jgi:hypothetical protein